MAADGGWQAKPEIVGVGPDPGRPRSEPHAQLAHPQVQEVLRLRAEYAQETARKMMGVAQQVAEIGNDSRVAFSRMLTEQLASGSQEMADAFQGFFKSLPGQNPNMMEMMQ